MQYNLLNPDWSQFVPSIIATVIGFLLAILFQQVIYEIIKSKFLNRRRAEELIKDIKKELDKIYFELSKLDRNSAYVNPLKTPVWDGILNTNELALLERYKRAKVSKKHLKKLNKISGFRDKNEAFISAIPEKSRINLYDRIVTVYSVISDYNEWNRIITYEWAMAGAADKTGLIKGSLTTVDEKLTAQNAADCAGYGERRKSIVILSRLIACTVKDKAYGDALKDADLESVLTKEDFE